MAFSALVVRLVDLQILNAGSYAERGRAQRLRSIVLPAERGSIFDRNGVELALSVRRQTVWADPRLVADPADAAAKLAPVLGADQRALREKLAQARAFTYLARQVDDQTAKRVRDLAIGGVSLLGESKRFTPASSLAAGLLGDVDLDNVGLSGLERQYEDVLIGKPGELIVERGPDGRTIAGGEQKITPSIRGGDLVLTLDRSLQFAVERALAKQMVANGAARATAIVMDPTNGEILAMANLRDTAEGPTASRDNWAVTAAFEPGSVNKVITIAGALEEGVLEPASVLDVPDKLKVSIHTFSDHDPHPTERWTVADILTQSSNVGTIKIAQRLTQPKVKQYLARFGLGDLTGLGFPQETAGIMKRGRWDGTDIGSIPIGQGVAVTALQMLQVFNTLANGGVLTEPRVVKATVDDDGQVTSAAAPDQRRVVSKRTADEMTAMMANVVAAGTGVNAQIASYTVAGKTGTARKPDVVNGGYEPGGYISSFAGFVPAESPRLSTIVVMDEPRPIYYAGLVAAPVFAEINRYALRLLRIPPAADTLTARASVPAPRPVDVTARD